MKVCRSCKECKAIEAFGFSHRWRRGVCRTCCNAQAYAAFRRQCQGSALTWDDRYELIERRATQHTATVPIPDSDPWLDLDVIAACWKDCVAEGASAIRRMIKRIVTACWAIGQGADQLHAAAMGFLMETNDLALVEARLRDVLALAVVA